MTAIVHDPRNQQHAQPGHPEHPGRYTATIGSLEVAGLLDRMPVIPLRSATVEEIRRVHSLALIDRIEEATGRGGAMLDPDTYCTSESWEIARDGSGALIDLCTAIAGGEQSNGLVLLRPPGHHATANISMGFCLINHVAIAARALQGAGLANKVAIVDFDVHHGNGTEDIFANDDSVFFASTHQYPYFPGTGRAADRGTGKGVGFTLNIPLPAGAGDQKFIPAYRDVIIPALKEFGPDFIIVSAGYDAHRDDPLAGLTVSNAGFAQVSEMLVGAAAQLCGGKIVFNLEGGYNLDVLTSCVSDMARILLDAT